MKKLFLLICFNLCIVSAAHAGVCKEHPVLKLEEMFGTEIKEKNHVIPYMVNLQAIYLLKKGKNAKEVKEYIKWYLSKINYPDKAGITGTMYDYTITCKGKETPTNSYDSADAYAGTFLYMLYEYYALTKDSEIIIKNKEKIEDIAYVIAVLQDEDGLTKALPGKNLKYLMDNCEAFGGIRAFNMLSKAAGWGKNPYYAELEATLKQGILEELYDEDRKNFYWAIEDNKPQITEWNNFYPDAFSQLFPVLYDVLDAEPQKKKFLFAEFSVRYENRMNLFAEEQKLIFELTKERISK